MLEGMRLRRVEEGGGSKGGGRPKRVSWRRGSRGALRHAAARHSHIQRSRVVGLTGNDVSAAMTTAPPPMRPVVGPGGLFHLPASFQDIFLRRERTPRGSAGGREGSSRVSSTKWVADRDGATAGGGGWAGLKRRRN